MVRKFVVSFLVLALLLVWAAPASAITFGEFDGNDHPYVGSMVFRLPDGSLFQWCSGTLIAPTVFLTASHCTAPVDSILAAFPGSEMLVTFDPVIDENSTFYTGTRHTNPLYTWKQNDTYDVAVIVLDQAPPITPAQLPAEGLLDDLHAQHVLNSTQFTAVGYGTVRESFQGGFDELLDNYQRNRVNQYPLSLTGAWITLSMNPNTGSGGTCYGDSGGPHFIWLDGVETNIVAAITVTGDAPCKATDKDYRMDTPQAREFLGQFVTLP
jgi:secreted trypsin-like serine protease